MCFFITKEIGNLFCVSVIARDRSPESTTVPTLGRAFHQQPCTIRFHVVSPECLFAYASSPQFLPFPQSVVKGTTPITPRTIPLTPNPPRILPLHHRPASLHLSTFLPHVHASNSQPASPPANAPRTPHQTRPTQTQPTPQHYKKHHTSPATSQ
ncbi:hypothetical protein K461DRAFT_102985 [Myriangium duriaei CBS 260.36]|uniref:Uncharacterized protein n=1 Tax=Myriangium duriaei CBS 260.36 TaxID=1168546 RepID=A0A9P4MM43_9PEZI|nr:hypothetical protein K461DRAFT_102985 [Myriangium duriaei CBS 260.36]